MNIFLHADGGPGIGLGHASRCSALAATLVREGHHSIIAVDPSLGLREFIERQGAHVIECKSDCVTIRDEAEKSAADIVVIDSYRWQSSDFYALRGDWSVVAFDDEATRELPVQGIINGAPAAEQLKYKALPSTKFWLGAPYQILRDAFRDAVERSPAGPVRNMIVLVGGDDPLNLLPILAEHLENVVTKLVTPFAVDLICGPFARPLELSRRKIVSVVRNPPDLYQRMCSADLALSASGQTLYELARCGTPTIAFCSGADQNHNLATLAQAGVVMDTGDATKQNWLVGVDRAMQVLVPDSAFRERMSQRAQRLIDGKGSNRLVEVLGRLVKPGLPLRSDSVSH